MQFRLWFFILFCIGFTGCASVFLRSDQEITVVADPPETKVMLNDSIYEQLFTALVKRSKEPLTLTLIGDRAEKAYTIFPSPNPTFLYGNVLLLWQFSPVGYAMDLTNPKRFRYKKSLFLSLTDTAKCIRTEPRKSYQDYWRKELRREKKGLYITFSLPYANAIYMQPQGELTKDRIGFFGFSTGMEFQYKEQRSIGVTLTGATTFFLPFPVPVYYKGPRQTTSSAHLALIHTKVKNRYRWGYGVSFSRYKWQYFSANDSTNTAAEYEGIKKAHNTLGTVLNAYHRVTDHFHIGLVYRPTFYRFTSYRKWKYEHFVSLDFAWRIALKK